MTKEEVVQMLLKGMLLLNEASLYDAIEDLGSIAQVLTDVPNNEVSDYVNAFLMTYEMTYEQEKMIPMNNRKSMVEGIISQMHGQDYPSNLSEEEYTWFMHGVDLYQKSTIQDIKKRTIK